MKPETRLYYLHHVYFNPCDKPAIVRCIAEIGWKRHQVVYIKSAQSEYSEYERGFGWSDLLVVDVETGKIVHKPQPEHLEALKAKCPEPDSALMAMVIAQLIKEGIYDERKTSGTGAVEGSL